MFSYLYRPPRGNLGYIPDYFDKLTFHATNNHVKSFTDGDFNTGMSTDSVSKKQFVTALIAAGAGNHIYLPARVAHYSSTVFDLILTNYDTAPIACGRIAVQISGHMPFFLCIHIAKEQFGCV